MSDLFKASNLSDSAPRPLADRLRPQTIDEIVGQDHVLGQGAPLQKMLASGRLSSLILWGPPGVGKTTLARLIADHSDMEFVQLSAVFSGVADLRKAFAAAETRRDEGRGTLLFVDEIHRFNRSQQDSFLPYVEAGTVTLIGATTENPSFELNPALLSRMQVFILKRLSHEALGQLLERAQDAIETPIMLTDDGRDAMLAMADGDGRYLLGLVETLSLQAGGEELNAARISELLQKRAPHYDKGQESHYNLISALHKSIRGSDPDAALYWFARMLDGGEDPLYIGRRLIRMASEDIGLADPAALMIANNAVAAFERLGTPEGELSLAHAVVHLATAPKSNAAYTAFKAAQALAKSTGSLAPPAHILNAPTKLMKNAGYGEGYIYDHDTPDGFSGQNYFPDGMERPALYVPTERGREAAISKRLSEFAKLRENQTK